MPGEGALTAVSDSPLSPLRFLLRSADVWAARTAVIDGGRSWSYGDHADRVSRLAGALAAELAVRPGDRVAALVPNVAAMLELHYAVPAAGGVLVPLNTRLTPTDYAYILEHSGATAVVASSALAAPVEEALAGLGRAAPRVVWLDPAGGPCEYEALIASGRRRALDPPGDERTLLSINYTSGTTGRPKGVMTSHRGAYLHTLGVIPESGLTARSSYLWTLPMFHCNGWAYIWAVTAAGARHVCLAALDPDGIWSAISTQGVTHMCAAPTVVTMMLGASQATPCQAPVQLFIGGAPPAPALLERAARLRIAITHLYGLTETYGPFAVCAWNPDWDRLASSEHARLRARQGVSTIVGERLRVVDARMDDVPRDGVTQGEVVMRGNNVMLGYYRDPAATAEAFAGGWFHSGDLAVMHPDGYVELRDRLKDVVISGGENIPTIEVEQALVAHPAIAEAAVVARADEKWGEVPVAFVTLTAPGSGELDLAEVQAFLGGRLARFKLPKELTVVDELPKTATGKIQKFVLRSRLQAAVDAPPLAGP